MPDVKQPSLPQELTAEVDARVAAGQITPYNEGHASVDVADAFGLSVDAVRAYVRTAMDKQRGR